MAAQLQVEYFSCQPVLLVSSGRSELLELMEEVDSDSWVEVEGTPSGSWLVDNFLSSLAGVLEFGGEDGNVLLEGALTLTQVSVADCWIAEPH